MDTMSNLEAPILPKLWIQYNGAEMVDDYFDAGLEPPITRYGTSPEEVKLVMASKVQRRFITLSAYESKARKETYKLLFPRNTDKELRCNISNAATSLGVYVITILAEPKPEIDGNADLYFWVTASPTAD